MPNRAYVVHKQWIVLWACFFSLGWLLPNHALPWITFHHDAWCALASAIVAAPLLLRVKEPWTVPEVALFLGLVACIPPLQWAMGLNPVAGYAGMSSAYLLGFFLVVACGACWETKAPDDLLDGLLVAIGLAALLSVWIQLRQWFELDTGWEWWSTGMPGTRPSANFSQPNQAATFLCLGLGSLAWGAWRARIGWAVGLLAAAYLLLGIALTGSRTAWLGLTLVVLAVWHWRHLWPSASTPWLASGLFAYLLLCVGLLNWLGRSSSTLTLSSASQRWDIWSLCLDAVRSAPWTGYGWNRTAVAELHALDVRSSGLLYITSAHNLFIDLVLWCGIPLGLALCVCIVVWVVRRFSAVKTPDQAILVLMVLVVLNHSMLEFPLHYAYLLLPTGWILGALEVRMAADVGRWFQVPRALMVALYLMAMTWLVLIIRDYFPIEQAYRNLHLDRVHVKTEPWTTPEAVVLTHLSGHLEMVRAPTTRHLTEDELLERELLTEAYPDGHAIFYLAAAEAINHRPDQAVLWLQRYCKLNTVTGCQSAAKNWAQSGIAHPEIAAIAWPVTFVNPSQP